MAATIAVLAAAIPARAEAHRLVIEGKVTSAAGTRSANVRILCSPDPDGGAISLELWVPKASALKDFDYDDFEGPDAAAASRALSHVRLVGSPGKHEIMAAAAGWYSGEDPDTFVLGVSQPSHHAGVLVTLFKALNPKQTQLVWTQHAYDDSKRTLRAELPLDAQTVTRIRDTVSSCLTAPAHGHKKHH